MKEIETLRGGGEFEILPQSNPYRILVKEPDGLTAYYFSCPVYRDADRRLLSPHWEARGGAQVSCGSNAETSVEDNRIRFKNGLGAAQVLLPENADLELEPTFNGVAVRAFAPCARFRLKPAQEYGSRENGQYFALMREEFVPFLSVSGICAEREGTLLPVEIFSEKRRDGWYEMRAECPERAERILFEINLHAPKMLFDTTVESANPDRNNAFGSVAFLGESAFFGEQWLYSRFDTMQLLDLNGYLVRSGTLYLPKYGGSNELEAFQMNAPWCSFGSTWNTKVAYGDLLRQARRLAKYEAVEVTDVIKAILRLNEPRSPGVVIKGKDKGGYAVVSTGDSYLRPQILELKLKNN